MIQIGAYEAKTHLSGLLAKVNGGEQVLITRHNVPIAKIVPAEIQSSLPVMDTISLIKKFRKGNKLGRLKLKTLIASGRK